MSEEKFINLTLDELRELKKRYDSEYIKALNRKYSSENIGIPEAVFSIFTVQCADRLREVDGEIYRRLQLEAKKKKIEKLHTLLSDVMIPASNGLFDRCIIDIVIDFVDP